VKEPVEVDVEKKNLEEEKQADEEPVETESITDS